MTHVPRLLLLLPLLFGCPGEKDTGGAIACGASLTCTSPAVCVRQDIEAVCENREDTATPCPDGTTESMCRGAGIACCCEPTPASTYSCFETSSCSDPIGCDCVEAACSESTDCEAGDGFYVCHALPMP